MAALSAVVSVPMVVVARAALKARWFLDQFIGIRADRRVVRFVHVSFRWGTDKLVDRCIDPSIDRCIDRTVEGCI